jgi:hypothetical protein
MEFLERPNVTLSGMHYLFDVAIPRDRSGHHVLWIAWQRDDPVGEVFFSASDIMVAPAESSLAGDFTDDGKVDAADYTAWRDHLGAAAGSLPNDVDGGVIGSAQYARWKENFGTGGAGANAVPEPALLPMTTLSAIALAWHGRRRLRRMPPCRHAD